MASAARPGPTLGPTPFTSLHPGNAQGSGATAVASGVRPGQSTAAPATTAASDNQLRAQAPAAGAPTQAVRAQSAMAAPQGTSVRPPSAGNQPGQASSQTISTQPRPETQSSNLGQASKARSMVPSDVTPEDERAGREGTAASASPSPSESLLVQTFAPLFAGAMLLVTFNTLSSQSQVPW